MDLYLTCRSTLLWPLRGACFLQIRRRSSDLFSPSKTATCSTGAKRFPADNRSIYRAPERLCHGNEKYYTPHIVSIGLLHHGKERLKAMEEHKMRYMKAFIERTKKSMEFYIQLIKEKEARVRGCYSETIQFNSDEFVKIILVDATYIIELFLRVYFEKLDDENDCIFHKPQFLWDIGSNMILLENQLPFFILEDLYVQSSQHDNRPSFLKLSHCFLKHVGDPNRAIEDQKLEVICPAKIEHFVDLLRQLYIPCKKVNKRQLKTMATPSVTELHQAGVKFKVGSSRNLFDIHFEKGILEIPRFNVSASSEIIIRNIMAFEQYSSVERYMNDYIVLLSCLVSTPKDVDLLVKYGVIEKRSHINEGANRIQNLSQGACFSHENFHFASLCEDLNTYCRASWHEWKANLKQNYFNTPWAIISFIAAVVLLLLTLIQAVHICLYMYLSVRILICNTPIASSVKEESVFFCDAFD
ncbi:hypothetical protein CJ030_MR5G025023 [Morella rubra]|uniref:Uncharacterized protein n=1 Tax=Morella rubra TaxID=262757 RepID=A0A6A1VI64_9ROSI|nr:hypothetical protein CJ030_MR5G025023 [Morella rubra]